MSFPRRIRPRAVLVVAVAVLALVAGLIGLRSAQDKDQVTVYAEFTDASPLIEGNDVKAAGVKVGQVSSVTVEDGKALVGLHVDPEALPIHEDAEITIRPVSLLGERYVELDRGSPEADAITAGSTIPDSQTGSNVDLDEVLNTVDQPTGKALAALLTTLGEGVYARGDKADATIRALAPALTDTQALLGVLDRQNGLLTDLIDQVQPVASAMASDKGRTLDRLITATDRVLGVAQTNQKELAGTIRELPGTLRSARSTLARLAGVADQAAPTLRAMRPTTDDLSEISQELLDFADAADPALASLPAVLTKGEKLLDEAAPLAIQLRRLGPDLRSTAEQARPVADAMLHRDLRTVMTFIRNWALTTNGRDGLSHYFRAHVVVSPQLLTGLLPGGTPDPVEDLTNPPDDQPGTRKDGPTPGAPTGPEDTAQAPLKNLKGLLGSATGLNRKQEQSMMRFLVGGAR